MEHHEAVDFLFDLRRFQVRPGIASATALREELGDPGSEIPFVQIAGSNGKGSTAKLLESVLREAGLSVGLYTSPHLETLAERIQVDGRPITDSAMTTFIERTKPWLVERAADGSPLTFFEVVTLMGIWYFDRQDVDVAVLEVGLGGEFDATSVVDPVASCVTTISREHTDVLGETIEEIATTKAAVAPANRPLVTGATGEALAALETETASLTTVGTDPTADVIVDYEGRVTTTEAAVSISMPTTENDILPAPFTAGRELSARLLLLGEHQARNAGIATTLAGEVIDAIGSDSIDTETIRTGLRNAHWPGRFEVMDDTPLTIFDGAHNPEAIESLATTLSTFEYDELHVVFGAMHDKPHAEMIAALPTPDSVITCRPNLDRAEDPAVLAEVFRNAGVEAVTAGEAVADALATAATRVGRDDCLLVTGSLFAVGEARSTITRLDVPKRVPDSETATALLDSINAPAEVVADSHEQAVHRTIVTQVDDRQASVLRELFPSVGGHCVSSGVTTAGQRHKLVLTGSLAAFRALTRRLDQQALGLPEIAADLRQQLGLEASGTARSTDNLSTDPDVTDTDSNRPWEDAPAVMGILNVTPDSFYDGGEFFDADAAIAQAEALVEAGADIIDIGGESTRPGAEPVPADAEEDRVVPVIEAVSELDVAISIDTRKPAVAAAALDAGADIVNDVTGLVDASMRQLIADREVPAILMHSIDAPVVPEKQIEYDDVVEDVLRVLSERVVLAEKAGIPRENIIVDPGIGFGKTSAESFELLDRLGEFEALGCPLLVGHSRKSMFSAIDSEPDDRLAATVAATAVAVERGADIVRVHDVAENRAAVDLCAALDDPDTLR